MNRFTVFLCSLLLILGTIGTAAAAPYTWTDRIDFAPQYIGWSDSYSYTHDITDGSDGFDGFLMGGDDIVYNYSLTVALHDDGGRWDSSEIAFIDQPGFLGDGFYNFDYTNQEFGWSVAGIVALNLNGTLGITIDSWYGDFYLDWSNLVATGDNGLGGAPVPEPATMLLLGTGLIGLIIVGRKKISA